ncbi:SusC/RagA family TonB-linked outer membrane protein [Ulvibacterium marinum]|uniref:SusC/RagA family TonB-linked outer membrane protein n=1 Tax=Ulvibacterium marinum TaxID=2419782 RepID=UPI002494F74D|nr:TonB-dependent receptor [Ulvibacterium marinum]
MKKQFFKVLGKFLLTGIFLICFGLQQLYAQQTITGTVTDENGVGIPGANIVVQGTTNGVVTDFDGNFSIEASSDAVLVLSYLGYATQNVPVGNQTTVNIQMTPDASELDEVVVIGYGTARKSDLTGAISRVTSESFEDQPLARVEDALQGRAAGVTVARQSGSPGGDVKIRIRGTNSISGDNAPLVVIDGIIGGDLSALNPNDIATLDVLKDASATAIYGSRGANGVILISTKKGSGKARFNVDYFASLSEVPKRLPTLQGSRAGDFARIENQLRGNEFIPASEIAELDANGGVDYQDELFQVGLSNNLQLSYSGGDAKMNYFVSGNYVNQEGTVIETGFERFSLRANVNAQINDKLRVGLNLFGSRATTKNNVQGFARFQGSLVLHAITWDPTTPIFDADGNYNEGSTRSLASLNYNPIARLNQSDLQEVVDRLNANVNVSYDIIPNLNYTLIAGASTQGLTDEQFIEDYGPPDTSFRSLKETNFQVSNILTWNGSFGNHNIKVTGLYEFSENETRTNGWNATNLIGPLSYYFSELAEGVTINNNKQPSDIQSYMGRVEYDINKELFLTGTIRHDGSSRFQGDNVWGTFYSFAGSYNFTNMAFIENSNLFSSLKLRAGWGQVGNQNIPIFSTFDRVDANLPFAFDGVTRVLGSTIGRIGNPDATWETTTQTNVGVDFGFWDSRVNLSLDVYKKNTTDLLLQVAFPQTLVGPRTQPQTQNLGEIENRGLDISLSASIIDTDNLTWDTNLNVSFIKNEVISLGEEDEIQGNFGSIDGQGRRWNVIQVGESLGQIQGSTFLGTWKSSEAAEAAVFDRFPGDAKYLRDADGNRVIGVIGNGTPTALWGWNNTLTYKNWDMNVFVNGSHGNDMLNAARGAIVGATGNQRSFGSPVQLNQWTPQNETDIPAGGENDYGSTRYIEKGGFVRLSNLNIGYTFRNVKGFESVKLYAGAQNLFVITDYSGFDPELTSIAASTNSQGFDLNGNFVNQDVAPGIDVGSYPNPRVFNIGVKFQLK